MLGIDCTPRLTAKPQGNAGERAIGRWFGKHTGSADLLKRYDQVLVEHVANTPELRDLYLEERLDPNGNTRRFWRQNGIRF